MIHYSGTTSFETIAARFYKLLYYEKRKVLKTLFGLSLANLKVFAGTLSVQIFFVVFLSTIICLLCAVLSNGDLRCERLPESNAFVIA